MEEPSEALSAAELKACGNEAYQRQDFSGAVGHWNQALRQFVEEMTPGTAGSSSLGVEHHNLEQSLYLNLAQGYLKLEQPERALRACVVVLHESAKHSKALFRSAEACLAMKQHEKAAEFLAKLLDAEPSHLEAKRLLQRVENERRNEVRKEKADQKAAAQRMLGACDGFSDGRENATQPKLPDSVADTLSHMDPESLCPHVDIAQEAAAAARRRESNLAAREGEKLPEPVVLDDLDAFRAKVAAKTQRFGKYMDRSKKQREKVGHGLKLAWLRTGQDVGGLGGFQDTLRQEASTIEAEDAAAVAAEEPEDVTQEAVKAGAMDGAAEAEQETVPEPGFMAEMD